MFNRAGGQVFRTVVSTLVVGLALALGAAFVVAGAFVFGTTDDVAVLAALFVALAEFGFVVAALVFLFASNPGREYVSVRFPDRSDATHAVGGTLVLYALALTATAGVRALGGTTARVPSSELAAPDLQGVLLAMVVLSVVVIGPSEELLFRGVVQSYLDGAFSRAGAVTVTSVLFAVVHVPTFASLTTGAAVWVLAAEMFAISVVFGSLYARTGNLVVPAVVHGVYDATLFGAVYVAVRLGLV